MGFSQGVSGLNAAAANLDVIGNNIANSSTVGFKGSTAQFADIFAGSRVGLGTKLAGVAQNFTQGTLTTSTRPLDVAIANGDGFFRLASPSGDIAYSRNGQLSMDKNGFLVNSSGWQVTGYQVSASGAIAGGSPTALQLPTAEMTPQTTTSIVSQYNLDMRHTVPTKAPFDPSDPDTFSYSNAVTIYDSLGNSHELTTYFVRTAPLTANTWSVYATADGWPLTAAGAAVAPTVAGTQFTAAGIPSGPAVALTASPLTFNTVGVMTAPATGLANFAGLNFNNGSAAMAYTMDFTGSTQFANDDEPKKLTQDGYSSGNLISFAINEDGTISGKYSNEQTRTLGQLVLSSFVNPEGLAPKGDNIWSETAASGQPLTGAPGEGKKVGSLVAGALESSNVDMTAELVNLIVAQRTYQANAQSVQAQSQVMQTLVNIR
jgi:flagellar hook protein FlgE